MQGRPRIVITTRLERDTRRFYLGRDYSESLAAAGGVPLHLGLIPDEDYVREALADADGVLLPGSNTDLDPIRYGEEPDPNLGTVIRIKDETDLLVLAEAERRGIPVFGICFGMQALNVSRGGSLVQDIPTRVERHIKHDQGTPYDRLSHSIKIDEDSILAAQRPSQLDAAACRVNSSHHQSVASIGDNLRVTAWAPDGVIECIEDTRAGRVAVGVQWHPEATYKNDEFSRNLFRWFVEQCREFAAADNKLSAAHVS